MKKLVILRLETLLLAENGIKHIPNNTFNGLYKLSALTLDNNELSYISDVSLQPLQTNLLSLNLRNNKLKTVPNIIKSFSKLVKLDLSFNQISIIDKEMLNYLKSRIV
eukprot:Pgem_evm1s12564